MKKIKHIGIAFVFISVCIFIVNQYVYAEKNKTSIHLVKLSDEFKNWVELSDEEKSSSIHPKFYDELNTELNSENPFYDASVVGASVNSKFNLKDLIPENLSIKNQLDTNACWAFSGLSSLETNLALKDYKNNVNNIVYDFSEKHANYATSRFFSNAENEFGFNRTTSNGGQWYLIETYLTNGQGAILEKDMPFDNNTDLINISEIQNKEVVSQVYDTVYFDNYNELKDDNRTRVMDEVKNHIQNYGSVFATIHGDSAGDLDESCYDNSTGAKFCDDKNSHPINHAVSLVGWDDDFDKNKFPGETKPSSNGAWIVRNSWGENLEYSLDDFKKEIFNQYTDECKELGWDSYDKIPDDFIAKSGFQIQDGKVYLPIGDNGFMYISYEDCNISESLYGIVNSSDSKDYDYLYQYDELYPGMQIELGTNSTKLCNIFERKNTDKKEYLKEVSLVTPETYSCKVFVNPNDDSMDKEKLQPVELKSGSNEVIGIGYHTLEFAEPIELTGDKFAVVVEIIGTRDDIDVVLEGKIDGLASFDFVKNETGKCFIFIDDKWIDLGLLSNVDSKLSNGDSSIKAFTIEDYNVTEDNPPEKDDEEDKDKDEDKEDSSKDKITNSNMDNLDATVKNIQRYTYTDNPAKDYTLVDVEIDGINRNTENDSCKYYYYLSTEKNLNSITDWVLIDEEQKEKNKLTFKIDSRDIINYSVISKNETLYIYIKEDIQKGDSQSIATSKAIVFETGGVNIDTYVDNVKKQNDDENQAPSKDKNDDGASNSDNKNNDSGMSSTDRNRRRSSEKQMLEKLERK